MKNYFRYGYRPIPSEIDTAELEMLREALVSMGNDVHLLDKWYRKDTNKASPTLTSVDEDVLYRPHQSPFCCPSPPTSSTSSTSDSPSSRPGTPASGGGLWASSSSC